MQDLKNRQNSVEITPLDGDIALDLVDEWRIRQNEIISLAIDAYQWAVRNGIAKEQARSVLPEGNTMSRLYMAGTLRSFIHYIDVRTGNGTQAEHMDVANKVANALYPIFPLIGDFAKQLVPQSQGETE
jgi:thymidylate synthase (FAD)